MSQSHFFSLTFSVPLDSEEILKGYFLMNHEVEGFEETSGGLLTIYVEEWNTADQSALQEFLSSQKDIELLESEVIEDKDWNAAWEATIEPIKITNKLVIAPSWKINEAKGLHSQYMLIIDPKMSFGTGHHETTRLCLQLAEGLDCKGKTILDIGTGTGALAMYGLMRGASHAVGIDTDEWSYKNAIENRKQNSFSEKQFDVRHGDLHATVKPEEAFDIIFANIHRNILLAINTEIGTHQKNTGSLILSGLLEYDADEIISAYETIGYELIEKKQESEWIALHFEKRQKP